MIFLSDVVDDIEECFGLTCITKYENDKLFIKIKGIDNHSLYTWIKYKQPEFQVSIDECESYKFSNTGWVIVECKSS